jgi:hypothetical protein
MLKNQNLLANLNGKALSDRINNSLQQFEGMKMNKSWKTNPKKDPTSENRCKNERMLLDTIMKRLGIDSEDLEKDPSWIRAKIREFAIDTVLSSENLK